MTDSQIQYEISFCSLKNTEREFFSHIKRPQQLHIDLTAVINVKGLFVILCRNKITVPLAAMN
jgi:hypothetical protein